MATDLGDLVASVMALLGRRDLSHREFQDWLAGPADGGANGVGLYPLTDSTGFVRMLPSPAKMQAILARDRGGVVYPDDIDPLAGTGRTHDDTLAIQGMFNAQYLAPYPRPASRPNVRYWLGGTIYVDPSRNSWDGNNCQLGWDLKDFVNPATVPNMFLDPGFDTGAPWKGTTADSSSPYTVFDGMWRVTQPSDRAPSYFERYQRMTCKKGDLIVVKITMDHITPVTWGVNTYRQLDLSLRGASATTGAITGTDVGSTKFTLSSNSADYVIGLTSTWTVVAEMDNPYIRIQGNCSFAMDYIEAKVQPNNYCMIVRVPTFGQGGTLRGHNQREFRNFKLSGRSGQGDFVDMCLFDTPIYPTNDLGQHSRVNWSNFDISDGVGRGIIFQNRTYLSNFHGFRIVCSQACVDTLGGDDTGENISFFGGNLGGGQVAVRNLKGYALRFIDTSMDFCRQWMVGTNILMFGGWLENTAVPGSDTFSGTLPAGSNVIKIANTTTAKADAAEATAAGTIIRGAGIPEGTTGVYNAAALTITLSNPTSSATDLTGAVFTWWRPDLERYLIDCGAGDIILRDVLLQQDGTTSTRLIAPFRVAKNGFLKIDAKPIYNFRARSGALCVGEGRFEMRKMGGSYNEQLEAINKRDDDHNILGAAGRFETPDVRIPAFLQVSSGQRLFDRLTLAQDASSTFSGTVARGGRWIADVSFTPTNSWLGRTIDDDGFATGATIVAVQGGQASFTGTTTSSSNVITAVSPAPTAQTAIGKYVTGPGIPTDAKILSYNNAAATITLDKQCTASASGIKVAVPNAAQVSDNYRKAAAVGVSLRYVDGNTDRGNIRTVDPLATWNVPAFDGARCLQIYKDLPSSSPLYANLCIPCEPGRGFGTELRWAVPPHATSTSNTSAVFFSPYFMRLIDGVGVAPAIDPLRIQLTEFPKTNINMATGTNGYDGQADFWGRVQSSLSTPGFGFHNGRVPEWATHLVWQISMISMPRGSSVLIDGLIGNNQ